VSYRIRIVHNIGFAALCLAAACSGQPSIPGQNQQVGGMPGGGQSSSAGTGGTGVTGGASAVHASGGSGGVVNCGTNSTPSTPLTSRSATGEGVCAGVTVASFLSAIYAQRTDLKDISALYSGMGTDGSYVYAYMTDCGSLRMVLKRGSGDCAAGCINNEYWYFDSDASCQPVLVGHYSGLPHGSFCQSAPWPAYPLCW
jgi:hypothetical protein